MMNSPFVVQQAQGVIARPEIAGISAPEQRILALYRLLFGRAPTTDEIDLGIQFVAGAESEPSVKDSKFSPWERYVQALLLSNEFVFVD